LGLEDIYHGTVEWIRAEGGDKSRHMMAASMWISCAEWPLWEDELCQALAVELRSTHFHAENMN